jgi:hypothetical protein
VRLARLIGSAAGVNVSFHVSLAGERTPVLRTWFPRPSPVASQAPWPYGQPLSMPGYYPVDVSQPPVGMALLMSPATMYPPTAMDDPNFGMASMPTFTPTFQAPPPPSDPSEWYNVVPPQQWAYGPPPGNIPLSHEPIAQLPAQSSGSLLSSSALDANAKEFNPKLQVN